MKRGSIWWAYIGEPQGSSPGYRRPVVIVQAVKFTRSQLRTVLVATISSNLRLADIPSNILVPATISTLPRDSVINISQVIAIDKQFFEEKVTDLPTRFLYLLDSSLRLIMDL